MNLSSKWQNSFLVRIIRGNCSGSRLLPWVLGIPLVLANGGCSSTGQYPVRGKVVDPAGQAIEGLEGSQIVFTMVNGPTSSVGEITVDGSFTLFTQKPGDGVPPGEYDVNIARRYIDPEHPAPRVIDAKYEMPATSGLKATVEAKKNTFEFKVSPIAKR